MDADSPPVARRPTFAGRDGLACLADMEAGFSGKHLVSGPPPRRRRSYRGLSSFIGAPAGRSAGYYGGCSDEPRHFLDACFLCKKPLGENNDIFMYRGDTPFCSEECRQEQIEIDEAKERNRNLPAKVPARKENQKSASKNQGYHPRTGTVAAG